MPEQRVELSLHGKIVFDIAVSLSYLNARTLESEIIDDAIKVALDENVVVPNDAKHLNGHVYWVADPPPPKDWS